MMDDENNAVITAEAEKPAPVQTKSAEKPVELNEEIQSKWASILVNKPGALEDLQKRVEALQGVDPRVHALEIKNAKSEAVIEYGLSKDDLDLLGDDSPGKVLERAKVLRARYDAVAEAAKAPATEAPATKGGGVKLPQIDPERAKVDPIGAAASAAAAAYRQANQ